MNVRALLHLRGLTDFLSSSYGATEPVFVGFKFYSSVVWVGGARPHGV